MLKTPLDVADGLPPLGATSSGVCTVRTTVGAESTLPRSGQDGSLDGSLDGSRLNPSWADLVMDDPDEVQGKATPDAGPGGATGEARTLWDVLLDGLDQVVI